MNKKGLVIYFCLFAFTLYPMNNQSKKNPIKIPVQSITINAALEALERRYSKNKDIHLLQKFAILYTLASKSDDTLLRQMTINSFTGEKFFDYLVAYEIQTHKDKWKNQSGLYFDVLKNFYPVKKVNSRDPQKNSLKEEILHLQNCKTYHFIMFNQSIPYIHPLPNYIEKIVSKKLSRKISITEMAKHMKCCLKDTQNKTSTKFLGKLPLYKAGKLKTIIKKIIARKKYEYSNPNLKDTMQTNQLISKIKNYLTALDLTTFGLKIPANYCDVKISFE